MSHGDLVPPGVDPGDADMLRRAYALTDQDEGALLYKDWASTYDRTMLDGLGYISPRCLADQFARHVPWRDRAIVDVGCGTGLIGVELLAHGFAPLDGLDLSHEMMAEAALRGVYREFLAADLNEPLPIADGAYAAIICNGTFTSGHVGAGCLDELVRVIEPAGFLACAVHHAVWSSLGFDAAFARLQHAGTLTPIEIVESPYYQSSSSTDGRLCLFRRR